MTKSVCLISVNHSYDCKLVVCLNSLMTFDLIPLSKLNERIWLGFVCRWSWRNDASISALLRLFPLRGQRGLLESFRSKRREHPSFNNSWFQKLRDLKALASSNYGGRGLQCECVLVFPCSGSLRSLFAFPCGGATGLETGAQLLCSVGPRWCTDAHSLETGFNFFLRPAFPLTPLTKDLPWLKPFAFTRWGSLDLLAASQIATLVGTALLPWSISKRSNNCPCWRIRVTSTPVNPTEIQHGDSLPSPNSIVILHRNSMQIPDWAIIFSRRARLSHFALLWREA